MKHKLNASSASPSGQGLQHKAGELSSTQSICLLGDLDLLMAFCGFFCYNICLSKYRTFHGKMLLHKHGNKMLRTLYLHWNCWADLGDFLGRIYWKVTMNDLFMHKS